MTDPADTPLARRIEELRDRMGEYPACDSDELRGIDRVRGWLEAVAHLSRHGGLSHAGREEANQMVAASEEWFADLTGEGKVL